MVTFDGRPLEPGRSGPGIPTWLGLYMSDDPTNTTQWERRVGREWYAIAAPERERDAPMLTDLFEGLS